MPTHYLLAHQLQSSGVISRDGLTRRRREPQDCVIHGVVGLRGDPCVCFFIEDLWVLDLKIEAPKSCPRLPEGLLDGG